MLDCREESLPLTAIASPPLPTMSMPMPLPYAAPAAAASRLSGLLLGATTATHADQPPVGIQALLSALAPYSATSRILNVDVATALLGADLPLPNASAAAASRLSGLLLLGATTATQGDQAPDGIQALLSALAPHSATSRILNVDVDAAAASRAATALLEADRPLPNAGAVATALLRDLKASVAADLLAPPRLPLLNAVVVIPLDAYSTTSIAAAGSRSVIGGPAVSGIGAPRHLLLSTLFDTIGAPHHLPLSTFASRFDVDDSTSIALAVPIVSRQPVARGKLFRQLNPSMKMKRQISLRREAGTTREPGVIDDLDLMLRDMGYITRGRAARYFVLFSVFTIMSEGVRECHLRFRQLVVALRPPREMGAVDERIVGECFGSLFE